MFETYTTVMGRVITEPRRHETGAHGDVTSFRLASYSRRRDRETGDWIDGPALYLTVVCWRRLAPAVAAAVVKGASIIVHGQLKTNEYVTAEGIKRSDLEMTATSLGLDLAHRRPESDPVPEPAVIDPETAAPEPVSG
ncbi:MAG: single-stranded DNA-binding protein [Gordonia sp. (in: high G+C Gram-positive bacteria)]|uniref:single-stranded DNA-binding protein n=1 Tax=Gordonia sp. (in: high G+C Gram-positive bacteria) TaxID=84139 RepID=UPI0039E290AE